MQDEPTILEGALKHGVSEDSIRHALRNAVDAFDQPDGVTMCIGPDHDGTLIEVGIIHWHGISAVNHALRPARTKYLR